MKKAIIAVSALVTPFIAFAQNLTQILGTIRNLASTLFTVLMIVACAVFVWGIVVYIASAGNEAKRATAKGYIIYGLVGLFVMLSFWGIITVVTTTFGFQTGSPPPLPQLPY